MGRVGKSQRNPQRISENTVQKKGAQRGNAKESSLTLKAKCVAILVLSGGAAWTAFNHPFSSNALTLKFDGGSNIEHPDFANLKNPLKAAGPELHPALSCLLKESYQPRVPYSPEIDLTLSEPPFPIDVSKILEVYGPMRNEDYYELRAYLNGVVDQMPIHPSPKRCFPDNLSAFLVPGRGLVHNGQSACSIDEQESYDDFFYCKDFITFVEKNYLDPKDLNEERFRQFGMTSELQNPISKNNVELIFGINPQIHANYKQALKYVEESMLQDDCFFSKESEEIVAYFKHLHKILYQGLPGFTPEEDDKIRPGEFRNINKLYSVPSSDLQAIIFKKLAEEQLGGKGDEENVELIEVAKKVVHNRHMSLLDLLSPHELSLIKNYIFWSPEPAEIPQHFLDFVARLKRFNQVNDAHPIAIAAWAHSELIRIEPFYDRYMLIPKILLNAFLVRGGYEPVIHDHEKKYIQAIRDEKAKRGVFTKYLIELMTNQKERLLANNCLVNTIHYTDLEMPFNDGD